MSGMANSENRCVFVYGNEGCADRARLQREFGEFGRVKKIFTENSGKYSKVYFDNIEKCKEVADAFKVNHFGWVVQYPNCGGDNREFESNLRKELPSSGLSLAKQPPPARLSLAKQPPPARLSVSSVISSDQVWNSTMDFADDELDFTANSDYCTLHGDPVVVLTDDSGEIYVNYRDVKKAGFALFRRENFDALLLDRNQVSKEFELFLLAEARNYILKRRLNFSEDEILSTIARCREKVLSSQSGSPLSTGGRSVNVSTSNLTVTSIVPPSSTIPGPREKLQKPRPPHKNYQRNNEDSNRNEQSFGGPNRGRGKNNHGRSRSRGRPDKSEEPIDSFNGFGKHPRTNEIGGNISNAQDIGVKPSDRFGKTRPDEEFGSGKLSDTEFNRNKQAGGDFRKSTDIEDTPLQNNRNNQNFQNNRGAQPKRQLTNSNVSPDDSLSVKSEMCQKKAEYIGKAELRIGSICDVVICYIESEKIQWVQTEEYNEKVIDMTFKLIDAAPALEDIANPVAGQLVLALHEDIWSRARVVREEPLLVHYLDYGNKNKPSAVKVLPAEYKNMPSAARRITGLQQLNMNMEENQKIKISIKQLYGDGTYLVKLADAGNNNGKTEQEQKIGSIKASSQEPLSGTETQPLGVKSIDRRPTSRLEIEEEVYVASDLTPLFALKNDEPVKIVGRRNNQLCIKNKECYEKSKELNEYIQNLDKSGLKLTSAKTGQLVLAKKDDAPAGALWYRAAVVSKESSATLEISYVDLKGEDTLGVKSLRNVDEHLASYPVLMTLTPPLSMLDSALEFVDQLIKDKTKMRLAVSGDDVDFRFEDGTLLSKKILNLNKKSSKELPKLVPVETEKHPVVPQSAAEAPIPPADEACEPPETQKSVTEPTPKPTCSKSLNEREAESPEHFTFNLMDWTRLSPGTHHVLFYTINDITDITVVSMEDKLIDQLAQVSAIQVEDDTPYEPMECEMCLVLYKSEAEEESSWYRAFITEINGENYAATCVDFGNIVVVTKREIRKFPINLKNIPMMGINCECIGIPNNDAVLNKLKELLPEGEQGQIEVVECVEDEMKCLIKIPKIYEALKNEGVV